MDKLLLIDGNSLVNRAYFALPPLNDNGGRNVNAVYGFVNLLLSAITNYQPTKLIVAFDAGGHNFRKDIYDQYKANRKGMPDDLASQMPILEQVLTAMSVNFVKKRGVEADDIIGTITNSTEMQCVVVTGDKDMLQLVDSHTQIAITKRGIADVELVTPENIMPLYGYTAGQVVEFKAMRGDTSDNIPGVKGVGEKTALSLLSQYGNIDEVYNNIDAIKGAMQTKLIADREMAFISRTLATIVRDIDVEFDIESSNLPVFSDDVKQLFTQLQFRSIIARLDFEDKAEQAEIETIEVTTLEGLNSLIELVKKEKQMAFTMGSNVEIAVNAESEYIIKCSDSFLDELNYVAVYNALSPLLNDEEVVKIVFDNKQIRHNLLKFNVTMPTVSYDLALMQYVVLPRTNKTCAELLESLQLTPSVASMVLAKQQLWDKLVEQNNTSLYLDVELPLSYVLFDMEKCGVKVDVEMLNQTGSQLKEQIEQLTGEIHELAGEEFNVASPKQLSVILFEKLALPHFKKTTKGYSTNSDVLNKLVDAHEIVPKIIEFRKLSKIYGTYIEGLKPLIVSKRVHTTYNGYLTSTGRLSSSDPNLQNIPIRTELGKGIRKLFVSTNGTFVGADYSQIELRLLASFSGDENLINAFVSGQDVHAYVASELMNIPIEMVNSDMRRMAKAVNFGIIYGISDFGLSESTGLTVKKAHSYIDLYFSRYPTIKAHLDSCVAQAKKNGYVTTMLNRRRYIPEINSANANLRGFGERAAMNMPLQGSSADIMKVAMIDIANAFKREKLRSQLVMQIHDEVIVDAFEEEKQRVSEIIVECMTQAVKLNCPLVVDVEQGVSLYEV